MPNPLQSLQQKSSLSLLTSLNNNYQEIIIFNFSYILPLHFSYSLNHQQSRSLKYNDGVSVSSSLIFVLKLHITARLRQIVRHKKAQTVSFVQGKVSKKVAQLKKFHEARNFFYNSNVYFKSNTLNHFHLETLSQTCAYNCM